MKNKEFIYIYWNRTELGRKMIASNHVSEDDLLFLIPNNVKKMHGLPLTRGTRKYKEQRKRFIYSFSLFDIIEEIIDDVLPNKINENLGSFVEIKKFNFMRASKENIL